MKQRGENETGLLLISLSQKRSDACGKEGGRLFQKTGEAKQAEIVGEG